MMLFSRFSKSAFWTPFLIGMVAVLALPAMSKVEKLSTENTATLQILKVSLAVSQHESEQVYFLSTAFPCFRVQTKQAIEICNFSANLYRLACVTSPPIRAGPLSCVLMS